MNAARLGQRVRVCGQPANTRIGNPRGRVAEVLSDGYVVVTFDEPFDYFDSSYIQGIFHPEHLEAIDGADDARHAPDALRFT